MLLASDLATGSHSLGARDEYGHEFFADLDMRGMGLWHGQRACDLNQVAPLLLDTVQRLRSSGVKLEGTRGAYSASVRQHDLVVLGEDGAPLIPALTWQCNAATKEVEELRAAGVEKIVGRIEPRFILPKMMWVLREVPQIREKIYRVMTTGDWIAYQLTGVLSLSTSDALSNGLLEQATKKRADDAIRIAGMNPDWFPHVLQSGHLVGKVGQAEPRQLTPEWRELRRILAGWDVVAGLGDNHATGVGCGLGADRHGTLVVSAGNSGTVVRTCPPDALNAGNAAAFEFYSDRLLLMMLADCSVWFDRFVRQFAPAYEHQLDLLDLLALEADPTKIRRVLHIKGREKYPPGFSSMTLGEQVASTQFSIMLELLLLVKSMLGEVLNGAPVNTFVLTGGLGQSPFFQRLFQAGIQILAPEGKVTLSARTGPMRFQTATYGALLNAELPQRAYNLATLVKERCPLDPLPALDLASKVHYTYLLQAAGL